MKKNYPSSSPQVNPEALYAQVNKQHRGQSPQQQPTPEPVYAEVNIGANKGRHPQQPVETVYAELNMGAHGGRHPQQPTEPVYAELNMGAHGERHPQQPTESVYAEVNTGRTSPSPRSPKDEITSKLLQNTGFQYSVREIQEWCQVVYGNSYALNSQLAQILDDPQKGDKVLWDVAANPESPGKLAGQKVLGMKSPARKEAEEGFRPLCAALERHVENVKKLHKDLTKEQARQQGHEKGENLEKAHRHHHHHHHRAGEERHTSQQREVQPRSRHGGEKGMAFAM
ncbi:BID domain-containing T4SS effector [Bartonella refiksaydamii]|uniref:BID domain-containing T4SS effector n=1 Tax=Bartonella refiksaydamii TaxID=2654951 RepID=UPI0012EB89AB|nr:BID domain-containing T4SS effector [Bartonella refiksaydamii]